MSGVPMRHLSYLLLCGLVLLACPRDLSADQQVTLKSGTVVVGDVSLDGDVLIVTMNDDIVRIPLADVTLITSVESGRDAGPATC